VSPEKSSRPPWEERSPFEIDDPGTSAVLGARPSAPTAADAPAAEVVCVPAQPFSPDADAVLPQVGHLDDGRTALLVYSSLRLLVAGCGKSQPWVAVRLESADALNELARLAGADVILRDVDLPTEARHTGLDTGSEKSGKDARS
jgi:hypothetical protein